MLPIGFHFGDRVEKEAYTFMSASGNITLFKKIEEGG